MKPVAIGVNKLIHKILAKQHPILAELTMNWGKIVGVKFSSKSIPMKIISSIEKGKKINILCIAVNDASVSLEMAYQQDLMIERIAVYLGYKGIYKIKLLVRG
ncbi:MAG: DciA family protein [Rickettsiaceae bacterium]